MQTWQSRKPDAWHMLHGVAAASCTSGGKGHGQKACRWPRTAGAACIHRWRSTCLMLAKRACLKHLGRLYLSRPMCHTHQHPSAPHLARSHHPLGRRQHHAADNKGGSAQSHKGARPRPDGCEEGRCPHARLLQPPPPPLFLARSLTACSAPMCAFRLLLVRDVMRFAGFCALASTGNAEALLYAGLRWAVSSRQDESGCASSQLMFVQCLRQAAVRARCPVGGGGQQRSLLPCLIPIPRGQGFGLSRTMTV